MNVVAETKQESNIPEVLPFAAFHFPRFFYHQSFASSSLFSTRDVFCNQESTQVRAFVPAADGPRNPAALPNTPQAKRKRVLEVAYNPHLPQFYLHRLQCSIEITNN